MIGDTAVITHDEVLQRIRALVHQSSINKCARQWGVSAAFLSDVLRGRRDLGTTIPAALGFTRQISVQYVTQDAPESS